MKQYLENLLTAICGKNLYRQKLYKLREQVKKAGENVRMLQDAYYGVQEKKAEAERVMSDYAKQMTGYQKLIENYRCRLKEKDAMIEGIRKDYQRQAANYEKRIGDYCVTIAELQKNNGELKENLNGFNGQEKKPKTVRKPKTKQ